MKIATDKIILFSMLLLAVVGPGCSLFSDFKRGHFDAGEGRKPIKLRVPKGYDKMEWTTDSTGHKTLTYDYGGGQQLYFSTDNQFSAWIDTSQHMPRPHLHGGVFYKGVSPQLQFWREVYSQGLRYGYRSVPRGSETVFDSALNYLRVY